MSSNNKLRNLHERKTEIIRTIHHYGDKKRELLRFIESLQRQYHSGFISYDRYLSSLNRELQNKTPEHWINYYNEHIEHFRKELHNHEREIKTARIQHTVKTRVIPLLIVLGILAMIGFGLRFIEPAITGFTTGPLEENISLQNITVEELIQGKAEINKPVKWIKKISLNETKDNLTIILPENASGIKASKIVNHIKEEISQDKLRLVKQAGISIQAEKEKEAELVIEDKVREIEVEYETEAPKIVEREVNKNKKEIIISSNVHYENITAYTSIADSPEKAIRLYRTTNGIRESTGIINYTDNNNNGLIDEISWIVPSLSNETYEAIIEITKASHLDENRSFINDIYEEVIILDEIFSETIPSGDYVRVTFERNLTSNRDITLYPRIINGTPKIEVYEIEGNSLVSEFTSLNNNEYNKVFLTNLKNSQHTFDLLVLDGALQLDHIIDPPSAINMTMPDAAAPGMNVVVQFIGGSVPNGNTFTSTDTVVVNNTAAIRVGPVIVTNNTGHANGAGNTLTTVFFINSSASDQYVNITIAGVPVVTDFRIITPTAQTGNFSGLSSGTYEIGDEKNGTRSKRGTIVLDSLIIPSGVTVNVNVSRDLDKALSGHQGYLPAVIIVDGPVEIYGTLNVSGDIGGAGSGDIGGAGGPGGPGGGGGGGGGGDIPAQTLPAGGDGFTGGGGGSCDSDDTGGCASGDGGNGTGFFGRLNPNQGTGGGGGNATNNAGGGSGGIADAADGAGGGGGTGFWFGIGGKGGTDGTLNGGGRTGGGGGAFDSHGGGGSFGSLGGFGVGGYGNITGTSNLVPLSGGSGGGGGGATTTRGGGGGGGGGAVLIYSASNISITGSILAVGGGGGVGGNSNGGGGSGGGIILQSPNISISSTGLLNTSGGNVASAGVGGGGRVRIDGPNGASSLRTFAGSNFTGPSITFVNKSHVSGYSNNTGNLTVFMHNVTNNRTYTFNASNGGFFAIPVVHFNGLNFITVIQNTTRHTERVISSASVATFNNVTGPNNVPTIPLLDLPVNNSNTSDNTPLLSWFNSTDADTSSALNYSISVFNNSAMTQLAFMNVSMREGINRTNITIPALLDGNYFWRVNVTDGIDWSGYSLNRTFTIDTTPPKIFIAHPQNITYATTNRSLNFTIEDNSTIRGVWYSLNRGINTTITTNTSFIANFGSNNTVYLYANDSAGNLNQSIVSFYVNTTINQPLLASPANNTNTSDNTPFFAWYNSTNRSIANLTYSLSIFNNSLMTQLAYMNVSVAEQGENQTNLTIPSALLDGDYFWRVNVTDKTNSYNFSQNFTFTIDTTFPKIFIVQPQNTTYTSANLSLNFTIEDSLINRTWYNLNLGQNITIETNTTFKARAGPNTIYLYHEDLAGNINSSNVSFHITSPILNIVLNWPPDPTSLNQGNTFLFNATVTCSGSSSADCENVYAFARFNSSSISPNLDINLTFGDAPFYTVFIKGNYVNKSNGFPIIADFPTDSFGRGIAFDKRNDSFWMISTFKLFMFHYNSTGQNQSDGFYVGNDLSLATGAADVAMDENNGFWFVDTTKDFVFHYNSTGQNQSDGFYVGNDLSSAPSGIAFDNRNNSFWILDTLKNFVFHYNSTGQNQSDGFYVGNDLSTGGDGIAFDIRDSSFWILEKNKQFMFHYNSTYTNQSDGFFIQEGISGGSNGITPDNKGNFWIINGLIASVLQYGPSQNNTLNSGQSVQFNWTINASGSGSYEVGVFVNSSNKNIIGNATSANSTITINVPAPPAGDVNLRPNITFVSNGTLILTAGGLTLFNISFIANDTNGAGGLNNNSIIMNATYSNPSASIDFVRNFTCIVSPSQVGLTGTERNYSCVANNFTFYDSAGSWNISISIADNQSNYTANLTQSFTIQELISINITVSSMTFPDVTRGDNNVTSSNDPQRIQNIGNKNNIRINLTAINLIGDSDSSSSTIRIDAVNFTINYITNAAEVECNYNGTVGSGAGARLLNNTGVPANVTIVKGSNKLNDTYICLLHAPGNLLPQPYSSSGTPNEEDWTLTAG